MAAQKDPQAQADPQETGAGRPAGGTMAGDTRDGGPVDSRRGGPVPAEEPGISVANGAGPGVQPANLAGVAAPVTGTRTATAWAALAAGMFFLVVVLVFILQNLKSVRVHFFWADWSIPLAVDLLLATVLGGLVMFTAGSLRILQLRRAVRHTPGTTGQRRHRFARRG